MKRFVVGGDFGEPKKSSDVEKLAVALFADTYNGGNLEEFETARNMIMDYDLVVWMPNVDNEVPKSYPVKKPGTILVCSKVLHDDRNVGDAVARIFKMNANAVIAISKTDFKFEFKLIDASGNLWVSTTDINELGAAIEKLANWTRALI